MEETGRYEGSGLSAPYRISSAPVYLPVTSGRINAVPGHIDRGPELRNIEGDVPLLVETFTPDGALAERAYLNHMPFLLSLSGFKGVATVGDGNNNVWTATAGGTITGGTFTITVGGQTTTALAWNATNAVVQAALEALTSVGVGNVFVSNGPMPATFTMTWRGALGCLAQTVTIASSLTGTSPTLVPTSTTAAVAPTVTSPDWATGHTFAANPQSFVGGGTTKWVFTKRVGAPAQTADIIAAYGDMGVWLQGSGFGIQSLGMNAAGELTCDLAGLVVKPITDPAYTPVLDVASILPAKRGDLYLSWLSGGGVIDDFSFSIANPLSPVRSLGLTTPSNYPDLMEQGDDKVKLTGSIPKRRINNVDFNALLGGTTFAASARWRTPTYIAQSPTRYAMWIEMPSCQLRAGTPDDLANRRRFGASYDFWGAYDDVAGYDLRITVIAATTAAQLSTPAFTVY